MTAPGENTGPLLKEERADLREALTRAVLLIYPGSDTLHVMPAQQPGGAHTAEFWEVYQGDTVVGHPDFSGSGGDAPPFLPELQGWLNATAPAGMVDLILNSPQKEPLMTLNAGPEHTPEFALISTWTPVLVPREKRNDAYEGTLLLGTYSSYMRACRAAVLQILAELHPDLSNTASSEQVQAALPTMNSATFIYADQKAEPTFTTIGEFAVFLSLAQQGAWEQAYAEFNDNELFEDAGVHIDMESGRAEIPLPRVVLLRDGGRIEAAYSGAPVTLEILDIGSDVRDAPAADLVQWDGQNALYQEMTVVVDPVILDQLPR